VSAPAQVRVHPTAIVDPTAQLGAGVEVGPYALIGPQVTVGDGTRIAAHAVLERNVRMGARCRVGIGAVVGGDPQDLKYRGEETWAEIGDGTVIREFVTVNRGTTQSFRTTVGAGCLLMSYVHLGHDCHVGDGVVLSSSTGVAGHVTIGERAIINGMVGIAQFLRIGTYAYVGGHSAVRKDIPPYCRTDGDHVLGLNRIGLERGGFAPEVIADLTAAYRLFYRSRLNIGQALDRAGELSPRPEVQAFVEFIRAAERGVAV
jgi:UDP-N-acetylglucosamine acyltransferase